MRREQNELLTRIEGDAPMGLMIRDRYWIPFLRAEKLKPLEAPQRVRLLGENFVAWRAPDGSVGFMDEGCPHRGASLYLGRNDDGAIQCVFHGWKFDTAGRVVAMPNESQNVEEVCSRVPVRHYPVREAGGLLWTWLGKYRDAAEPQFPEFEFTKLPLDHVWISYSAVPCNWAQGVDATVDSSHVGLLHQSWVNNLAGNVGKLLSQNLAPRYEVQDRPYGVRAAALRPMEDGSCYARVGEFVMPFFMMTGTSNAAAGERTMFICVPVDDQNSILFLLRYSLPDRDPIRTGPGFPYDPETVDLDNFAVVPGDAAGRWGQDRSAMAEGHFTGYPDNLLVEDVAVQVSMGRVVDRTKEFLNSSDVGMMRVRHMLLKAAAEHQAAALSEKPRIDYPAIRAESLVLPAGQDWREAFAPDAA
jgi:nitrite reductase/ring-hydroxylating ferredoxin subunit